MFDQMTSVFYVLEYIFCLAYILSNYVGFGATLPPLLLRTTIINYILLYQSYRKIKDMAEKEMTVEVIREGQRKTISSK